MAPLRSRRIASCCAAGLLVLCVSLAFSADGASATKKPPLRPININSATSDELQQVPGIGPATADKILQMRKSYGPFKSVDDLLAIRGIGKKRLDKMRKYLTAGKSGAPGRPATVGKGTTSGRSAQPAQCSGCARATPPAKRAALPVQADPKKAADDPPSTVPEELEEPR